MKISFKDKNGEKHSWDFVMPTVAESVVIEDTLDMGAVDFLDAVGQFRGRPLRLLLKLLYKRKGLMIDDVDIDGDLESFEIEESARERRLRERQEVDELAPSIVRTLKDFGIDATLPKVKERLIANIEDEGKDEGTPPVKRSKGPKSSPA